MKYLTKSKFTLALDCPTKLYYATHKEFKSTLEDNDFLEALAKGGIQVGELSKLYYPGGTDIETLDYKQALHQTQALLQKEEATIYEAAIRHQNCFIRIDVLLKEGKQLQLIEVKSKSWDPEESFLTKSGTIYSGWQKYCYDVAFQYWVLQKAFPDYEIDPYLMLIDKSREASIDGLHQHFKVEDDQGRSKVVLKEGVTAADLGQAILHAVPVQEVVDLILSGHGRTPMSEEEADGFDTWVKTLMELVENDEKYPEVIGEKCKKCEYRIDLSKLGENQKSGFIECWQNQLGWDIEMFHKAHVFDIWNERGVQAKYLDKGLYFMEDLVPGHLPIDEASIDWTSPLTHDERKTIQILKQTGFDKNSDVILPGLYEEMQAWTWPLHFIDFEAVLAAIPFHKGLHPYEFIPFQFSCHTLYEDGRVEHRADWIEEKPGVFPNFEFVRQLKACLEVDRGTVFRYHNFENTVLNKVAEQLERFRPDDWQELTEWIHTLTRDGEREMVDLYRLIKDYYYSPHMGGSISIKKVLPAVLTESAFLQAKYSQPYSGLFLKDKIFYHKDPQAEKAMSPYRLLNAVGHGIPDADKAEDLLANTDEVIADGGTAMMAWSRLQFNDMPDVERQAILHSLYEYCELDTLAMVMVVEYWINQM